MVTVLSAADRYRQPWANELGTTSEVMIWPPGSILATCKLRVSIADMVIDSAFSALHGIDRTLVALAGGGIDLLIDGQVTTLEPFEVARFSGDSVVSGGPRGAATQDLNLMVRRPQRSTRQHSVTLQVFLEPQKHTLQPKPGHTLLAIIADGTAELSTAKSGTTESSTAAELQKLALADAVLFDDGLAASIHSSSALILIDICND